MPFTILKQNKLDDHQLEIEGEIHADELVKFRKEALEQASAGLKVDGFRPGHIPEKVIVDKIGELAVVEEAGRFALEKHYIDIIKKAGVLPLGLPEIRITKVAPNEPFGFKMTVALMPTVELADYKSIAKKTDKKTDVAVTDEEIENAIKELQKQIAHADFHETEAKNKKDGVKEEAAHDHAEHAHDDADGHDHEAHDHGDLPLPEVNLDFVQKFGAFDTVDAFKARLRENMTADKERREKEKARISLMDAIIEKTEVSMPRVLVDGELQRMLNELAQNISQMGLDVETYLKHVGKTIDDLKKEWEPEAIKRAKTQIILNNIATKEKLEVPKEEIAKEVSALLQYYKDAEPSRAEAYIETMLLNEKVWQFLESQK